MAIDKAAVERFWVQACQATGIDQNNRHYVWSFGDPSVDGVADIINDLVRQVLRGKKRGTSPCRLHIEKNNLPIPRAGDYWIVTESTWKPQCLVHVEKVEERRFRDVDEAWATREGEADGSHEYWYGIHRWWIKKVYRKWHEEFTEDVPVMLVYFDLVFPKTRESSVAIG